MEEILSRLGSLLGVLVSLFLIGFYGYCLMTKKKWGNYVVGGTIVVLLAIGILFNIGNSVLCAIILGVIWLVALGEKHRRHN